MNDESVPTIDSGQVSAHEGTLLLVTVEFVTDSCSVMTHGTGGTLRRYADDTGNQLGEITFVDE